MEIQVQVPQYSSSTLSTASYGLQRNQATNLFFSSPITEKRFSVQQSPLLIAEKNAELFCNYTSTRPNIEAVKATLYKGATRSVKVCSVDCNITCSKPNGTEFSCHVKFNKTEKVVIFNLKNLQANQTDIYICKIEVIWQAPYEFYESHGTVIHVKGMDTRLPSDPFIPQNPITATSVYMELPLTETSSLAMRFL